MPLKWIGVATVQVSDQDKALDFYVHKLGFELVTDQPLGESMRWVQVRLPGAQTSVVLAKGYGTSFEDAVGKFTGMVFYTDDIQATFKELSARGVTFTEAPQMQPWGQLQAQFEDQDGNGYVLVQP